MFSNFARVVSEHANGLQFKWRVTGLLLSFLLYRTIRKWVDGSKVSFRIAFSDVVHTGRPQPELLLKGIGAYLLWFQ